MALRFAESFDHYTTVNQFLGKWTGGNGVTPNVAGRNGNGIQLINGANMELSLDHQSGWTVGFAHYLTGATPTQRCGLYSGYHNDVKLTNVFINADGSLEIVAGTAVAVGTSSLSIHKQNRWYYFEYTYGIAGGNPMSITSTLNMNGTAIATMNGVGMGVNQSSLLLNTPTVNRHEFNGPTDTTIPTVLFDDIYINDTNTVSTGAPHTSFSGDMRIIVTTASADSSPLQWTPNSGTTHFSRINEASPDDDSTYIYSTGSGSAGNEDRWTYATIATFTGTIQGVQISLYARKDDEGSRAIFAEAVNAGTKSSSNFWLDDNYTYYPYQLDVTPAGGTWDPSGVNTTTWGGKIVS